MDITKQLTAEQVQGYLARGVALLPHIYEHLLVQLNEMERNNIVCMLPLARFDLYHIQLKKRLIYRIEQYQERNTRKKAA